METIKPFEFGEKITLDNIARKINKLIINQEEIIKAMKIGWKG